jgi:putative phage-type endonuclease
MTISPSKSLIQGSPEWLSWRREGIGASDSASLMLVDPYGGTPRRLYESKIGVETCAPELEPAHLRAGHEIEAMVRAMHEFSTDMEWTPACFEHPEFPFIRASLDGWNNGHIIEIKLVSATAMEAAIPDHHMVQLQHQMLVTGADSVTYLRHARSTGTTEKIEVPANPTMQRDILTACWKFWACIQEKTPPPYSEADWVPDESEETRALVREWAIAETTLAKKKIRESLLAITKAPRVQCGPLKIQKHPFKERVWS